MGIDWTVLRFCNQLASQSPILSAITRVLVNEYVVPTALALLLLALWFSGKSAVDREQNQRAVLSAIAAVVVVNVLIKLLNVVYYRPRPFATHTLKLLFYRPSDSSFPSNAAAVAFCIAISVWLSNRRVGLVMCIVGLLFALARMCSGVHYPSDILGGLLVGAFSAYIVVRKAGFLHKHWTTIIYRMRRLLLA